MYRVHCLEKPQLWVWNHWLKLQNFIRWCAWIQFFCDIGFRVDQRRAKMHILNVWASFCVAVFIERLSHGVAQLRRFSISCQLAVLCEFFFWICQRTVVAQFRHRTTSLVCCKDARIFRVFPFHFATIRTYPEQRVPGHGVRSCRD